MKRRDTEVWTIFRGDASQIKVNKEDIVVSVCPPASAANDKNYMKRLLAELGTKYGEA